MERELMVKDLTMLLLYLTAWDEKVNDGAVQRSWKGYPWDILDALASDGLISHSKRAKSVYLTLDGIRRAEKLWKKFARDEKEGDVENESNP